MTDVRFDFGFIPSGPVADTVGLVRRGEELGYRCAWIPDQGFHRDPFALLAVAAEATTQIGLGVGITTPFTRLPLQIARSAATVDELAEGRFRLGLGTGNVAHVLRPLGVHYAQPVARMREAIRTIRKLLAGEVVTVESEHDHLDHVQLEFPPLRANIPMYVGTRAPRMLEMSGAEADGVLVESLFNALPSVKERLAKGAESAGRSLEDVDIVSWQLVHVTDDPGPVVQAHKPWIARSIQIGPLDVLRQVGIDEDVIRDVTSAMDRGDAEAAANAVTDDAVQCLMLIGTAEDMTRRIERILGDGANAVGLVGVGSYETFAETLTACARRVMPAFRPVAGRREKGV
jgi:5,10-methylenetetrahydromethanopterin reductase